MIGVFVTFWRHQQAQHTVADWRNSAQGFVARERELLALDQAWHDEATGFFLLNALGGTGKTALLQAWLGRLEAADWLGADRVYAWSFPDITDAADVPALVDEFIEHALQWFGNHLALPDHLLERVTLLAKLIQRTRALLVLDNFPSVHFDADDITGESPAPQTQALGVLINLLAAYNPGLCVIASRQPLPSCEVFQQHIVQYTLPDLNEDEGAKLLRQRGVLLLPDTLRKFAHDFCGHALTLNLLGSHLANGGRIEETNSILAWRDKEREGLQARRVLALIEQWLWKTPELLLLYLITLLDRPVTQKELFLLLHSQRQVWFQRWLKPDETLQALAPLSKLSLREFSRVQRRLYHLQLITAAPDTGALDVHSLLRTYFRERVRARFPGIPERLQSLLEKCTQTLATVLPPDTATLPGSQIKYLALGHSDLQATVTATRSLGVKLEKSALQKHWYRASIIANHLCEHHLILGNLAAAMYCARRGVAYAELSHDQPSMAQNMQLLSRLLRLTGGIREATFLLQRARNMAGIQPSVKRLSA
ncbi:MAG: hypothetical protein BWK73_20930 [Thiothrix lacustris]|uniref:Orc1-like AAA ATPase domain-containing protein n=1 Tax=Thiothrix lacustris TaxID=525917 RepID=A0A1Y1QPA4_9GAMM|nr:MAG: hypothetical protein BWK73_20930 [Thiothrix lacustris]